MLKVGINGFGRIGRTLFRMIYERDLEFEIVVIKDWKPATVNDNDFVKNLAYLLKNDSIYGVFPHAVDVDGTNLIIDSKRIPVHLDENITAVDWDSYGCDVIIESSGTVNNINHLRACVKGNVKKGIITRGVENVDFTMIFGVNENKYDFSKHHVISTSTCTGNAFAPLAAFIDNKYGIRNGVLTTVHPVLSNEKMIDGYNSSFQLGRAAKSVKLISTGIVESTTSVLPNLKNKLMESALSYRIPTDIVSSVLAVLELSEDVERDKFIRDLECAVSNDLKEIVSICEGMFGHSKVSIDYLKNSSSSIIDKNWIDIKGNMLRLHLWHDNEYGYCSRVYDTMKKILS